MRYKFLFGLLVTVGCLFTQPAAADAYHDSLATYMSLNKTQLVSEMYFAGAKENAAELWGDDIANAYEQFVGSWDFFNLLVDIYEPEFRQRLPQEELDSLLLWFRSSFYPRYNVSMRTLMKNLHTEPNMDYLLFLQDNIERIEKAVNNAKKNKPTKISKFSVPKTYREEYAVFAQLSGIPVMQDAIRMMLTSTVSQKYPKLSKADLEQPEAVAFMDSFVNEALVGAHYKIISINELKYCISGLDSPASRHYKEAQAGVSRYKNLTASRELAAFVYWLKMYNPGLAQKWENRLSDQINKE